jgi:murein DD-endopeptidase MepM/ murein hydrolase activator NlpD
MSTLKPSPRTRHFSLLIVRGDGVRVLRLNFPRRLPVTIAAALTLGGLAVTALAGDWWYVRQRLRASASLFQQVDEQKATIDGMNRRIADLRREITGWREVHARIWEAFGPEVGLKARATGIGGKGSPSEPAPAALGPAAELDALAEQVKEQGENLRALDRLVGRARRALAMLPSRWPVRGAVNSEYGQRLSPWTQATEFHGGIDIAADPGTSVRAPAPGTVVFAGRHGDYGLAVVVDHGQEIRSLYGHLSRIHVKTGQTIERGTELGLSGNTGRSSGPHLHYEVMVRGRPVNPRAFLWD